MKFCSSLIVIICFQGLYFFSAPLFAQTNQQPVIITGQAFDANSLHQIKPLQIINTRNIQRFYGDSLGNFIVQAAKSDTLYFVAKGYATVSISYKDSPLKKIYVLNLKMHRMSVNLPEVTVQSNRDFEEVHHEAQKLGYNQKDYMVHGYQIIQSPFTYLYELLSTREKDKRGYAQLMNEGKKKELVNELVTNYVSLGILNLTPEEVNDFVEFTDVPENFLKTTNEYDFIRYLQMEVEIFHHRVIPAPPDSMRHYFDPHK